MNAYSNPAIYGDLRSRQEAFDRQAMNDVRNSTIRGTRFRKTGFNTPFQPSNTCSTEQHSVSTKLNQNCPPILLNLRITLFALQVLNNTTTLLSGTTTSMRDFLTRLRGRAPLVAGVVHIHRVCRAKRHESPLSWFFAAQQPPPSRGVLQASPDHHGAGSDVTNLCKDEIYLLSPNTVGLFRVARCLSTHHLDHLAGSVTGTRCGLFRRKFAGGAGDP